MVLSVVAGTVAFAEGGCGN
ncbi:hypothetical protein C8039_07470 [Halogeometricum sp. wsp3]|nr:hypothetical protein C8039_07470 [Halogeometricum sp. wsp3]